MRHRTLKPQEPLVLDGRQECELMNILEGCGLMALVSARILRILEAPRALLSWVWIQEKSLQDFSVQRIAIASNSLVPKMLTTCLKNPYRFGFLMIVKNLRFLRL